MKNLFYLLMLTFLVTACEEDPVTLDGETPEEEQMDARGNSPKMRSTSYDDMNLIIINNKTGRDMTWYINDDAKAIKVKNGGFIHLGVSGSGNSWKEKTLDPDALYFHDGDYNTFVHTINFTKRKSDQINFFDSSYTYQEMEKEELSIRDKYFHHVYYNYKKHHEEYLLDFDEDTKTLNYISRVDDPNGFDTYKGDSHLSLSTQEKVPPFGGPKRKFLQIDVFIDK